MTASQTNRRWGLVLVLGTVALGASCSSVIKGQSAALDRGREGDEARPYLDLSKYVKSREQTAPSNTPAGLLADDPAVPGRKKWQNPKLWPRNYKFALAIAPLREDFRRSAPEGTDPNGEPRSNFSSRTPDAPIDDDGKGADGQPRPAATLPATDAAYGFEVKTLGEGVAEPTTACAPSREAPASAPIDVAPRTDEPKVEQPKTEEPKVEQPKTEEPKVEEDERPKRIGLRPGSERHFAATGSEPATTEPSKATVTDSAVQERARHVREISDKEGMNFSVDSDKFQERAKGLLEEFRVFENVDPIKYGDDQKTLDGLFRQADARRDDFLLVCQLRRNKVSYRGADLGPAALDNFIEFLFLFNDIWSPIHREQYECDVELYVRLYDVRSRHVILDQTFEGHDALMLSTGQRGWHPLRNWISWTGVDYDREGLFYDVGEYVRPGAWMDMEIKLLDSLQNTVKAELDGESFDAQTNLFHDLQNGGVTKLPVRQLALVCGITEYGPGAQPRLAEWAADSKDPQRLDAAQKELVKLYDGQPVKLGTRPYAETDASRVKELLTRQGALGATNGLSDANVTANVQTLLGKDATLKDLRAAFRQVARARLEDRVFIYLNGETLVMDDPTSTDAPPHHYFLPYDVDLAEFERLYDQDKPKAKAYLDDHALSFEWIEACFLRDSTQDHIYLQSRHSFFIVDCSFPGTFTGSKFCPGRAALAKRRMLPLPALPGVESIGKHGEGGGDRPPEKQPERTPEKQPEKQPEKAPAKGVETPPPVKTPEAAPEEEERPKRVGFVNPSRFRPTTVLAQTAPVDSSGVAAVGSEGVVQFTVTTGFLERIAQGGHGRFLVLTTGPDEQSLDVPSAKMGGFVYYFTQFLDPLKQARFAQLRDKAGDFLAKSIVDYATDRLESESRQAGRPQHVLEFGATKEDYLLLGGQR